MELPLPPLEMRQLVGPTDPAAFDNPSGRVVFEFLPPETYRQVFEFGCGCGRLARQLIQQRPQPAHYVGTDLHRGMIEWCQRNLATIARNFEFFHHDVYNYHFNPGLEKPRMRAWPVDDRAFSLVEAWSVFTHLTEAQATYYLGECSRVLSTEGILHTTWFLFDKMDFPMLTDAQNALYASDLDPSAAVMFDRSWLRSLATSLGLVIFDVRPTVPIRGYQWQVLLGRAAAGRVAVDWPVDDFPSGKLPPPALPDAPSLIGLETG